MAGCFRPARVCNANSNSLRFKEIFRFQPKKKPSAVVATMSAISGAWSVPGSRVSARLLLFHLAVARKIDTYSRERRGSPPPSATCTIIKSTTWCWVVPELSLEAYFHKLEGKAEMRVVCMDLATGYRSLVRLHFPNARIGADSFHVIRIINHHFLACWRDLDPSSGKNRGVLSLLRRHRHYLRPKQQLRLAAYMKKTRLGTHLPLQAAALLPALEEASHPPAMPGPDPALPARRPPVAPSRPGPTRATRPHSFGLVQRDRRHVALYPQQRYRFRNFQNYRLRVKVLCG